MKRFAWLCLLLAGCASTGEYFREAGVPPAPAPL